MTDDSELERFKAALKGAPDPDPDTKARHIARAVAAFEENTPVHQGQATLMRPTLQSRFAQGARGMIEKMTGQQAMAATTGLMTAGLAVLMVGQISEPPVSSPSVEETATNGDATVVAPSPTVVLEQEAPTHARARPSLQPAMEAATSRRLSIADAAAPVAEANTERFPEAEASGIQSVAENPVSTFSVDVDTASYAYIRSSLLGGLLPPKDAVRIEEMVNYFPYAYPTPTGEHPFAPSITLFQTPWNEDTQLLRIALQGTLPAIDERPPLNLVFLIDTSGSMQDPDKLPLLKQSLRLLLGELRSEDEVAIVTYAGNAGVVLEATAASETGKILAALEQLDAGGSTAGEAGLAQAYAVAESMSEEGEVSRVLLATDGDFNVGLSSPEAMEDFIAEKRDSGTYLSVLGFGRGNLNDALMQSLAQNGNGQAAYIDTLAEAQKVLVDQLTGALFPIASDVKLQVEFNPATVAEYRLIGYETRTLRREDFSNDKVDAGDIGAGHQVTALYEVTPVGSPAVRLEPSRYSASTATSGNTDETGFLRLRYKSPGTDTSTLIETPIPTKVSDPNSEARFATAIAGFGELLRGSTYLGDWTYDDAIALGRLGVGEDRFGYRSEALRLMRIARGLSQ